MMFLGKVCSLQVISVMNFFKGRQSNLELLLKENRCLMMEQPLCYMLSSTTCRLVQ